MTETNLATRQYQHGFGNEHATEAVAGRDRKSTRLNSSHVD